MVVGRSFLAKCVRPKNKKKKKWIEKTQKREKIKRRFVSWGVFLSLPFLFSQQTLLKNGTNVFFITMAPLFIGAFLVIFLKSAFKSGLSAFMEIIIIIIFPLSYMWLHLRNSFVPYYLSF